MVDQVRESGNLTLGEAAGSASQQISFDVDDDVVLHRRKRLPFHSNAMVFAAADAAGQELSNRMRTLAVALERLRWLDRAPARTRIDVNTASTTLAYWRDGTVREQIWMAIELDLGRFLARQGLTDPRLIVRPELPRRFLRNRAIYPCHDGEHGSGQETATARG